MDYASDPTKDIHRDVAAKLFCCKTEQVSKELRYLGKNGFVFPRLYGSWYCNIASQIWQELKDKTIEDKSIFEWLNDAGISELGPCDPDNQPPSQGTFEYKVKEVQDWFDNKFYEFATKKEDRYQKYLKRGWFKHPTGFVQSGLYTKKDTMNHPIQGPAFHCLLWTAIRVLKKIKKRKMKSKPVAEIHDELLADCPLTEVQDYLNLVKNTIADLPNHWKWIKVPLAMEAKWSTESWAQMKVIEEKEGDWQ
jgi:DNA polymerase I-like protein with 3'-5' exonuclease and polymerase domains